ncbi:MAG TPA: hypothetical protein VFT05_14955 [Burkholderiaceae bacterium]|nr:hypothetical protein [Burkholderiaceae bacterium]
MRRAGPWLCALLATALAAWLLYRYGMAPLTSLLALALLACPVLVIWGSWRLARQTERDIRAAVRRARADGPRSAPK